MKKEIKMKNKTSESHSISHEIILLVCDDENKSSEILGKLVEGGASVVGPVSTARLSLALAALTAPTLALVATPPTGKRGAAELARTLMREWDIPSIILCDHEPAAASAWDPRSEQLESFNRAMGGRLAPEGAAA
jgi:hypothetical protein